MLPEILSMSFSVVMNSTTSSRAVVVLAPTAITKLGSFAIVVLNTSSFLKTILPELEMSSLDKVLKARLAWGSLPPGLLFRGFIHFALGISAFAMFPKCKLLEAVKVLLFLG